MIKNPRPNGLWGITLIALLFQLTFFPTLGNNKRKNNARKTRRKVNKPKIDDQEYNKRFTATDKIENCNLIPYELGNMCQYFFQEGKADFQNAVEIIKREETCMTFYQSYGNKPLLPLKEPLGKPFLLISHGDNGILQSFHMLLNYSLEDKSKSLLPQKFFTQKFNLSSSDNPNESSMQWLIPIEKLSLANLFAENIYPYGISIYYDDPSSNSFNQSGGNFRCVFYYYLALHKNDIEKKKIKEGKLSRKITTIKKGYIIRIECDVTGLIIGATASTNFFTKHFNHKGIIKNTMTTSCVRGKDVPPMVSKISNMIVPGNKLRLEIAAIILNHKYGDCKKNIALHLWMIDPITNKMIHYFSTKKCCDTKLAGFLG
jgi:hypothetical protein